MDHTHAFTCGRAPRPDLARIDNIKEEMVFGLFPEFGDFVTRTEVVSACEALAAVPDAAIRAEVDRIPPEWQVDAPVRQAISDFLCQRKIFVADELVARLFPQSEFNL